MRGKISAISKIKENARIGRVRAYLNLEALRKYFSFFVLVGVFTTFSIANERFFTLDNFTLILTQGSVIMIAAMGAIFVILAGSIDLSVGSTIGIGSAVIAVLGPKLGLFAFIVAALAGLGCGTLNGLMFAKGKIPSFVATLATLTILRGIVFILTKGITIPITDPTLKIVGLGNTLGIPNATICAILIAAIAYYLCHFHRFGVRVAAIGGAERVAKFSGIFIDKTKIEIFALAGLFAGVAGSIHASRVAAGSAYAGLGDELGVIAAVVIGGTTLSGGLGGIGGTVIGSLIIAMLSNGLNVAGIHPYIQMVISGIVFWVAVLISIERARIGIIK